MARFLPLLAGLALWASSLPSIDLAAMNDFGLISVLPVQILLASMLIAASALWHLRSERISGPFLALHLAALILILYGTPTIVEEQPRFATTYIHAGFSEYITRPGKVAPELEARFDWPGFFILASMLLEVSGLASSLDLSGWAPVYFNLAYLLPLALLFRAVTDDQRLVWGGLLVFVLGNWVGQDYYSPQALNYFLFISMVGLVLTYFRVEKPASARVAAWLGKRRRLGRLLLGLYRLAAPEQRPPADLSRIRQCGLIVAIVVVFSFVALSHQLTPFFTVAALLTLVIFNRVAIRSLPILLGVIAVVWVSYMTVPFLSGHVAAMLSEFGQLTGSVGSNVTGRLAGSPDHRLVVLLDMVFSVSIWSIAAAGFFMRFRDGRRDVTLALLIAAPVPLVATQAYGGELVLRLYLFTLPFMAVLAAGLLLGRPAAVPSVLKMAVATVACCAIVVGFWTVRYGNERMDVMTTEEVQGIDQMYRVVEPGSFLLTPSGDLPWRSKAFEKFEYQTQTDAILLGTPAELADLMRMTSRPHAYLVLTASERAEAEMFSGVSTAQWDLFLRQLRASPLFTLAYENRDVIIFKLVEGAPVALAEPRTAGVSQ